MFIFEADFVLKIEGNQCLLSLSWNKTKHRKGTANEETHLFIFIKFTEKYERKKNTVTVDKKKWVKQLKKINWQLQ